MERIVDRMSAGVNAKRLVNLRERSESGGQVTFTIWESKALDSRFRGDDRFPGGKTT